MGFILSTPRVRFVRTEHYYVRTMAGDYGYRIIFTWVCRALFRRPRIPPSPVGWKRECKGQRVGERPTLEYRVFASVKIVKNKTRYKYHCSINNNIKIYEQYLCRSRDG